MMGVTYTDMAIVKKHVKAIIQLRRAKESEWIEVDPILRVGEPALSTDVYKLKIGDGRRHWADIPYLGLDTSELTELLADYATKEYVENFVSNDIELINCGTSTTVI